MNEATHSFSLKQMCVEVAEKSMDLGAQSAQQLKIAAMSVDERKTFAATKDDLGQNTTDIQKAQRTVDVPLLQYIDTNVGVPAANAPQKQHVDCITKHNEVKMDRKAAFSIAQDREQEAEYIGQRRSEQLAFQNSLQEGVPRHALRATLNTPAKTVVRRRSSCARSMSQSESSNRSSMCLCHCRFWKRPSQ